MITLPQATAPATDSPSPAMPAPEKGLSHPLPHSEVS